jgi:hypothetical protein
VQVTLVVHRTGPLSPARREVRDNASMTARGRRRARRTPPPWGRVLLHVAGALCSLGAWGSLVSAAVALGREARHAGSFAWLPVALAVAGAVACLLLALVLLVRALLMLGVLSDYRRKRARR